MSAQLQASANEVLFAAHRTFKIVAPGAIAQSLSSWPCPSAHKLAPGSASSPGAYSELEWSVQLAAVPGRAAMKPRSLPASCSCSRLPVSAASAAAVLKLSTSSCGFRLVMWQASSGRLVLGEAAAITAAVRLGSPAKGNFSSERAAASLHMHPLLSHAYSQQ